MSILARVRGIVGQGLLWGAVWSVLGGLLALALSPIIWWPYGLLHFIGQAALTGAIWGLVSGGLFASALLLAEQRHTLAELSRRRVAIWGILAGSWPLLIAAVVELSLPVRFMTWPWLVFLLGTASAGAGSALTMLRVARRALPGSSEPPALDAPTPPLLRP